MNRVKRTSTYRPRRKVSSRSSSLDQKGAALVHEIRNPLTALSALVQLLPEKWEDRAFRGEFHTLMTREIARLSVLTESLLGRPRPEERSRVDLNWSVERAVLLMSAVFDRKRVRLKVRKERVPAFWGDEDRVESLLLNLLRNALEMTASGGRVEISTFLFRPKRGSGQRWAGLKVVDEGPGVPLNHHSKVFDAYFSTKKNGVGLGLAVCRKVAEDHGGTIEVLNTKKGAAFQVLLPIE